MSTLELNSCQKRAWDLLKGEGNVFLSGVAGSGKSHLIREFLREVDEKEFPILASTGAAAILVGGRTFHSFFGLGILQGGLDETVDRALKNKRLLRRLRKTRGVVIDEVSMLSGLTLRAAETIARKAREREQPWGGMRVITVGDFCQLPPVSQGRAPRDWAFLDECWERSGFKPVILKTMMRSTDPAFLEVLNHVRKGRITDKVRVFLDSRRTEIPEDFAGTRLFPHRATTEDYNRTRLEQVPGQTHYFETQFYGTEKGKEDLRRFAPVPEVLHLKEGALIMLRQNDPRGRWVNGTLAQIRSIDVPRDRLKITIAEAFDVEIERASFSMLDAEGNEIASAKNFPVSLAYASTIHKSQGMTLDRMVVDLRDLWEPGQAYVALSRVRSAEGLYISSWSPGSIQADPRVEAFNRRIWMQEQAWLQEQETAKARSS